MLCDASEDMFRWEFYSLRCLSERKEQRLKFNRKLSSSDRLSALPRIWRLSLQSLLRGCLSRLAETHPALSCCGMPSSLGPISCVCVCAQSCLTFCDPCFSVHGIFQARVLERVAISFSRRSSQPRRRTFCVSCIGRQVLHHCTTWEARPI